MELDEIAARVQSLVEQSNQVNTEMQALATQLKLRVQLYTKLAETMEVGSGAEHHDV